MRLYVKELERQAAHSRSKMMLTQLIEIQMDILWHSNLFE